MKVRYPELDFSEAKAHWAKSPEFAQMLNAFSTVPAHIEPFLVKVMRKVKKDLDPKHEKLHADIDIFNKQEIQHCKFHLAYNNKLYTLGYEEMPEREQRYKDDYAHFFAKKSQRFNVAYCEGFEALGSAAAQIYFEDFKAYFEGADKEAMNLWLWHLAEEFEHREVCADVYRTLYGNGPLAYVYRVTVFIYALAHIGAHTKRITQYLIGKDRKGMNAEQLKASKKEEAVLNRKYAWASIKRLKCVLSPFYDPGKRVASPGMEEVLAAYSDTRNEA
jgi:hypothetical protein